jgi:SAM-dependent methyltransferase
VTYDGRGLLFGTVAQEYDQYRPSPPPDVSSILGDLRGVELVEIGAGTGLWTRYLDERGAVVTPIEPDDAMRAVLIARSPHVSALAGSAEQLPLPDASFDAALVSSAWHWFEQPAATNEIARVLRDGARLFVLWNGFSRDVAWLQRLTELRENPNDVNARPRGWRAAFVEGGDFVDPVDVDLNWTWTRTTDQLFAVFGTYSGTIVKSDEERITMEAELRRRINDVATNGVVEVPMTLRGTVVTRSAR